MCIQCSAANHETDPAAWAEGPSLLCEQKHKEKTNKLSKFQRKIISRFWDHYEASMYFPTVENNFQPSQKYGQ